MNEKFEDLYTLHIRRSHEPYADVYRWSVVLANNEGKVKALQERHMYSFLEAHYYKNPVAVKNSMCEYFGKAFYPENYK